VQNRKFHLIPHSVFGRVAAVLGSLVVIAGAASLFIYFVVFPHTTVAPLALQPVAVSSASASAAVKNIGSVAGSWKVVSSRSTVGYRVREQLASLNAPTDAVGRTDEVTGSVVLSVGGTTVTLESGTLTANVQSLKSDNSMRDAHIQQIGLDSDDFPTAVFVLTEPVTLPSDAVSGSEVSVTLSGKMTIHGDTQQVSIPVKAQYANGVIQIVGSLTFPFSKFGMQAPDFGGFVTVLSDATLEFDVYLAR
jgi:polyisoprenoid-binding protein YceI